MAILRNKWYNLFKLYIGDIKIGGNNKMKKKKIIIAFISLILLLIGLLCKNVDIVGTCFLM